MKRIVLIGAFAVSSLLPLGAQNDGGISDGMLLRIRASYEDTPADRALRNAICNNDIRKLVVNQPNQGEIDTYFSHRVPSKGVTDQQQSGRCWLFSGLNVLRARMIARYGLGAFEFSQNYCFFWDQLEKANLFLQGVIDTRDAPREDRTVEWLFKNPLSDGGQFTGVADIVSKYGLVPKEAMPETYSSEHTAQMASLLKLKLREYGLSLREAARDGAEKAELESRKTEMLGVIYRMLVLNLGEPPVRFTWTRRDAEGRPKKWMVENSWGPSSGYKGHLIMTDRWFDEYMFRLVVERKYVPQRVLDVLKQKPVRLPAWDPMFADEE